MSKAAIQQKLVDKMRAGAVFPPNDTLGRVRRKTASTAENNAVTSAANTNIPGWSRVMSLSDVAEMMLGARVAASIAIVAQGTGVISEPTLTPDVVQTLTTSIDQGNLTLAEYETVAQTKLQSSLKLTGVGYFVNYQAEDIGEGDREAWYAGLSCPDVENQFNKILGASTTGGGDEAVSRSMMVAQAMSSYVTARDGASFMQRITDLEVPVMTNSETRPRITTMGLFLLPHRMRHACVINSLQVQVPQEYYANVAGGTAEIWVDGDLVYEDVDGVLFARALQGDATPAELPVNIACEAHSKVEVILELGSSIDIPDARVVIPPITGALRVSRV